MTQIRSDDSNEQPDGSPLHHLVLQKQSRLKPDGFERCISELRDTLSKSLVKLFHIVPAIHDTYYGFIVHLQNHFCAHMKNLNIHYLKVQISMFVNGRGVPCH